LNYFVYVLRNDTVGRLYVGHTDDLTRRLAEHNGLSANPNRYTGKFAGDWRLIYHEEFATRAAAMSREKWLKSGVGRSWLDSQFGRASPPPAD
jgi:putative endonuclease